MVKRINSDSKAKQDVAVKQYEAVAQEREALRKHLCRLDEKMLPKITVSEDGKISLDHPSAPIGRLLLCEQLGTSSPDFAIDIVHQLLDASQVGSELDGTKFSSMLAMVINSKPQNEFDTNLATLAAIMHHAAVKLARQIDVVETLMQQDGAVRMSTRLTRTLLT